MSDIAKEVIIIFYIPNSINYNSLLSNTTQFLSTCECSVPKLLASKWEFIDKEANGNTKALTSRESNISNNNKDWDIKILFSKKNGFSIKN